MGLLLLGIWAIMQGGTSAEIFHSLTPTFLGTWLFITGIVVVIELLLGWLAGWDVSKVKLFKRNTAV